MLTLSEVADPSIDITDEDRRRAEDAFLAYDEYTKRVYEKPKRPQPKHTGIRNVLITSALPYVNNVPHLGNMIGSTLSASVFALYCDLAGHNVLSICGTDEYGTATEAKAVSENMTPREICDKYFKLHCEIYKWFQIEFDYFGRTTTTKHTEIVQELFKRLWDKGFISEDSVEQLYCEKCVKFLADRFVEGVCPLCKYNDARGDQCDKCGRLMNAIELIEPRCKTCCQKPVVRSSRHLFLDLPKIEDKLNTFVEQRINDPSCFWTSNACTISNSWLRDGLKPRCITRDLHWGVPVPLEAYKEKVFYVWFDAPIGYLSITANYTKHWQQWWQPSSDDDVEIELFQFMAKDNVPFHAIIFPACLLAADAGHTLVKHLLSTEYMNYENTKFSKSRGIGVFGDDAIKSGVVSDVWRFYLLYRRPESQDSDFMWEDFMLVNNSELLNNLGNFVNRSLSFVSRFFNSMIPPITKLDPVDTEFLARINNLFATYIRNMESCHFRDAIRSVLAISRLGNGYFQTNQPWVTVKKPETKPRSGIVISVAANVACLLGAMIYPYMPTVGKNIWIDQCNLPECKLTLVQIIKNEFTVKRLLPDGHLIGKVSYILTLHIFEIIKNRN
ncbi:Methionine--tRNA ligase isoform 3 [Schistosoma japonicum]|uniref:Methionine--tRNA ligase, cytoplasmic n=1 Tax=Schistosoma japonicum TaxID=6182 RepID=A0A4Z2D4B1_SCHJA|nr:Methionine--tRNA ligase isoform 3 [Schistosoma japonicum]